MSTIVAFVQRTQGSGNSKRPPRLALFDAVRGAAVLAMMQWHIVDAWAADTERARFMFGLQQWFGGFAAPSFMLLAGLALGLRGPISPEARDTLKNLLRGMRIVLAGYALSLFRWTVDHAGICDASELVSIAWAALGLIGLFFAMSDRPRSLRRRACDSLLAGCALSIALTRDDARIEHFLRRDVLHGIGAALIATSLALHATRTLAPGWRVACLMIAAALVAALSTVIIGVPGLFLPSELADWIARESPESWGFPLFPWLSYALAGAALALAIRARAFVLSHRYVLPHIERPLVLTTGAVACFAFTFEPLPAAQWMLEHAFDLRSLVRLVWNASAIAMVCGVVALIGARWPRGVDALCVLGRHSLVVYAVHLEFAYGLVGVPLQRTLGLEYTWIGAISISMAMLAMAVAIEYGTEWHRERKALTIARFHEHARTCITRLANGLDVWLHR